MGVDQDANSPPEELSSPSRIAAWLRSGAAQAEKIHAISILCGRQAPAKALCMVSVAQDYANAFAAEFHGQIYGFSMVIVSVDIVPGFRCAGRPQLSVNCSCVPAHNG